MFVRRGRLRKSAKNEFLLDGGRVVDRAREFVAPEHLDHFKKPVELKFRYSGKLPQKKSIAYSLWQRGLLLHDRNKSASCAFGSATSSTKTGDANFTVTSLFKAIHREALIFCSIWATSRR